MISELNWLDIIFLILLLGMIYKGVRSGVAGQIIPLLGTFALLFLSIRYYKSSSEAVFGSMLQDWSKPVSFFVIGSLVLFIAKIIEKLFTFKPSEDMAVIERLGGIILAVLRTVIICGAVSLGLLLIPINGVNTAVTQDSKLAPYLANIDMNIYCAITGVINNNETNENPDILKYFSGKMPDLSSKTSGDNNET